MDDDIFDDGSDFSYSKDDKGLSYNKIVLKQISKCAEEGSKEMKPGMIDKDERGKLVYIEDQRQIYIQCVKSFYDLLIDYFDKEMQDADREFEKEEEEIMRMIRETLDNEIKIVNDQRIKNKLMRAKQTGYLERDTYYYELKMDRTITNYRMLYRELIRLYLRKNGLEDEDIDDSKA